MDDNEIDIEDLNDAEALGQQLIDTILERSPTAEIYALIEAHAPLWYQSYDGMSALHAAVLIEDAKLVRLLLEKGSIWNAVDGLHNTAGDIALSLNNQECYELVRDAGTEELLLSMLAQQSMSLDTPSTIILKTQDQTASGDTDEFLSSKLKFTKDENGQEICVVDAGGEEVGVMMGWERDIMQETVRRLCDDHPKHDAGLKILNVGFGLGMIDTLFESLAISPALHVIIEPHPDVLEHMQANGWTDKSNVKVLKGKWQDLLEDPVIVNANGFDIVYTDTFSEEYSELKRFFQHIPKLMAGPESRFSFFHGLGATNALFYDVYTCLSEIHLAQLDMDISWSDVCVRTDDDERWGATRKYFTMPWYRMPIGQMAVAEA